MEGGVTLIFSRGLYLLRVSYRRNLRGCLRLEKVGAIPINHPRCETRERDAPLAQKAGNPELALSLLKHGPAKRQEAGVARRGRIGD